MTCRHCGAVIHRNPTNLDEWVHANLRVRCNDAKHTAEPRDKS